MNGYQMVAAVAIAGSVVLAWKGREGWGWLVFIGFLLATYR